MPNHEFSIKVKGEVAVNLARHLSLDKPTDRDNGEKNKLITRMVLKHRDDRGHEQDVLEWHGHKELYETSLDIIARSVELAACRDAAYQVGGDIVYALVFHAEDHPNRSRFMFKVPGGQELSHIVQSGPGRRDDNGSSFPERIMPDILRYVSQKEEQLDKRSMHLWEMLMKSNVHLSAVVQDYTDREGKLREIELNAEDHNYERAKKRREDERAEKEKQEMWSLVKEHGPKALPVLLTALQRFSSGPNGPYEPGFADWWAEYQRAQDEAQKAEGSSKAKKAAGEEKNGDGKNGGKDGDGRNGSNDGGSHAVAREPMPEPEIIDAEEVARDEGGKPESHQLIQAETSSDEGDLGRLRLRVAFDAARFVMLARGRGRLDAMRQALSRGQQKLFDDVVAACSAEDAESDAAVAHIADLSLAFGAAMRDDPGTAFGAYASLDKMCQLSLKELSGLLESLGARTGRI